MNNSTKWNYSVLASFNEAHYTKLLTESHLISTRTPINVGDSMEKDIRAFFILEKNKVRYALAESEIGKLPIVVERVEKKFYGHNVYDIITGFKSAKFVPEKHFTFRFLVNDTAAFEHSSLVDFTLWKIMVFASRISRLVGRVSSPPAFGKDSVLKVLGSLLGDIMVVSNPTTAKVEYSLYNKVLALNEMANLGGEERRGMEHFLLSTGDLSPIYEKRSRATESTRETYDISKLSLLIIYNNKDCYPKSGKYFDQVFQRATTERFMPFKFEGQITQHIEAPLDPRSQADLNSEYYKRFIRTVMWYQEHWFEEVKEKKGWIVKKAVDYGLRDRWASNFNTIRYFIILYSSNEDEAQILLDVLFNRHQKYLAMIDESQKILQDYKEFPLEEIEQRIVE